MIYFFFTKKKKVTKRNDPWLPQFILRGSFFLAFLPAFLYEKKSLAKETVCGNSGLFGRWFYEWALIFAKRKAWQKKRSVATAVYIGGNFIFWLCEKKDLANETVCPYNHDGRNALNSRLSLRNASNSR